MTCSDDGDATRAVASRENPQRRGTQSSRTSRDTPRYRYAPIRAHACSENRSIIACVEYESRGRISRSRAWNVRAIFVRPASSLNPSFNGALVKAVERAEVLPSSWLSKGQPLARKRASKSACQRVKSTRDNEARRSRFSRSRPAGFVSARSN